MSSTMQVGLRMGGMRIDTAPALGVNDVRSIMGCVVMDGATAKPVPEVTASALEVSAEGGEVTLTASSALAEAIYVLNDTMCGHAPSAVWCSQSAEQIPAGGGQIMLTLAANTTGQPRQVWVFVGHHYAQTAVVEINQLA
ncbi:MAG: BACON domain-containing protein [Akkermansia sp.]|nr:BACON domain-containing protein [Akkermansia sp.]